MRKGFHISSPGCSWAAVSLEPCTPHCDKIHPTLGTLSLAAPGKVGHRCTMLQQPPNPAEPEGPGNSTGVGVYGVRFGEQGLKLLWV